MLSCVTLHQCSFSASIRIAEVSDRTGLSVSTIRKLTRCGEIPHIKVGRRILYLLTGINDWLAQNTTCLIDSDESGDTSG